MLDRLIRAAAEATQLDYMVLGLRYGNTYEFISTYGVPLTGVVDRVPSGQLGAKFFAREIEVEDLQRAENFIALDVVPIARAWRYGCNVPIKLVRTVDEGAVFALSGAHSSTRTLGTNTLSTLRKFGEFIADCIWLITQLRSADSHTDLIAQVSRVLAEGVRESTLPIAIVDDHLNIVGFSPRFSTIQQKNTGGGTRVGQSICGEWLDPAAEIAAFDALSHRRALFDFATLPNNSETVIAVSFYPIAFPHLTRPFGLLSPNQAISNFVDQVQAPAARYSGDGEAPLSEFLFETLQQKRRLLERKEQSYLAVRSWRKDIKKYQLAALKALKRNLPESLVEHIAEEIALAVTRTYGSIGNVVVTSVPCGHSGDGCLSMRLGKSVAVRLGCEWVEAFEPLESAGSSHPKTNVRRKAMKIAKPIDRPVILIDDVATSGAHIEEASRLLGKTAPNVWPVVWIAD